MNGDTICNKERVKDRWAKRFEDILNKNSVTGKDIVENKKFVTP